MYFCLNWHHQKKVDLLNCWMLRFQILDDFAQNATDSQFSMYHVITYNDSGFSCVTVYPSADLQMVPVSTLDLVLINGHVILCKKST